MDQLQIAYAQRVRIAAQVLVILADALVMLEAIQLVWHVPRERLTVARQASAAFARRRPNLAAQLSTRARNQLHRRTEFAQIAQHAEKNKCTRENVDTVQTDMQM